MFCPIFIQAVVIYFGFFSYDVITNIKAYNETEKIEKLFVSVAAKEIAFEKMVILVFKRRLFLLSYDKTKEEETK